MTVATFNSESYLTLERAVMNVLDRYGATVIPLEAYFFDWDRLVPMFEATVQQFEAWVPCIKTFNSPKVQEFQMPDDCKDVRSVRIRVDGIVATDQPVLELGRDYNYNKFTNRLFAYVTGLSIQYLAKYSLESIEVQTEPTFIVSNMPTVINFPAIPHPTDFTLFANGEEIPLTPTKYDASEQEYTCGSYGTLSIDCARLKAKIQLSCSSGDVYFKFKTRYKAVRGLDAGQEFFEAALAEKLLTMQGNIKAVCNFSSMPNNITADSLAALGASIHSEVEGMKRDRNKFWLGIQAMT